jgi:hypothetical protein
LNVGPDVINGNEVMKTYAWRIDEIGGTSARSIAGNDRDLGSRYPTQIVVAESEEDARRKILAGNPERLKRAQMCGMTVREIAT